ncbi:hypothetical protein B0T36_07625 [Nocardia donostiensis]|uniref:DUF4333 domain-containing protein n=1 Tax=Nocardia donostiensis TaxID=1538463 RepID=UPI0009DA8079|nr:DUF4333 domain-containing protein [Nocardia donostiensis]OQS15827.1 hypothetical protein B0T36_07625 [Nocardia donostiensis]
MSGPYGPNDAPGPGEGRNDPTQMWGQQAPGVAGPQQQWGSQQPSQPHPQQPDPQQAQPTQQWGSNQGGQQQWGQPQQQWGSQQPSQPHPQQPDPQQAQPTQQWGSNQGGQQQWGQQPQPQQQWGQQPNQDWGQPQPQPQWGQPQPQQQWGQPAQQQPGGGKKTGLVIGLAVLALAVIGGIVTLILLLNAEDELDKAAVQDGVQKVLSESYGIEDVSDVSCPAGQEVKVDATFTCDLKVSGEAKTVSIKITKEDGTYEVGRPN